MTLYLPHFNLQNFNSLASPVMADFFVRVDNLPDLLDALKFAQTKSIPILPLGGGSNLVLTDDFHGLVIHIQLKGIHCVASNETHVYVTAAAGENWHEFVTHCLDHEYWGLENLSLIPGCVGAAPIQNIGAYGVELKDVFHELTAIDIGSGLPVTFTLDSCQFSYRESVFKQSLKDKFIITSVTFKLSKTPNLNVTYPALRQALDLVEYKSITPPLISEIVCDIRRHKLPDPNVIPNVGSFFKNPIISMSLLKLVQRDFPDVVFYKMDESRVKLAAGWLIEHAGWKGYSGEASVHEHQALVLTNPKRLKGGVVMQLAEQIIASVHAMFGVELEAEPRIYP